MGGFGGFGGASQRGPKKTKDIQSVLEVTLEEIYNGCSKSVKITRKATCKTCKGHGSSNGKDYQCKSCDGAGVRMAMHQIGPGMYTKAQVRCGDCRGMGENIPNNLKCTACGGEKKSDEKKELVVEIDKGTKDGKRVTFRGESHEVPGYQSGDVIFIIKEKEHKLFKRDGVHLFMEKEIPLVHALTGYQFVIPHLDGRKLLVKTTEGDIVKPADAREIPNEGMPVPSRPYEHGNLYVKFKIVFPEKLTKNQIGALRGCLTSEPAPSKEPDMEEVSLKAVNPHNVHQGQYEQRNGNAYDEDSDDEQRGHGGVTCAQQ